MLAETIRSQLGAVPFVPFAIRMNDGRVFEVKHPDFADVSPKGSSVVVYNDDDGGLTLSSILIASVEPLKRRKSSSKK